MNTTRYATKSEELARLQALETSGPTSIELAGLGDKIRRGPRKGEDYRRNASYFMGRSMLERRRRFIQVVTRIWADHGIIRTTNRALARAAGISDSTANYLVGQRHEMLAEIIINHVARLNERVRAAGDGTAAARPAPRLEAILSAFLTGIAKEPHAHFLLHHAIAGLAVVGREQVRRRYRAVLEMVAAPLHQLAPAVEDQRVIVLILAVLGSVGDARLSVDPSAEMDVTATAGWLTAMLMAAVGASGGVGPRPGCGGPLRSCAQAWLAEAAG